MPDYTREYEVTAYLEVQGSTARLPVVFKARGLVGGVITCARAFICVLSDAYIH
jgi:hypothetical protein